MYGELAKVYSISGLGPVAASRGSGADTLGGLLRISRRRPADMGMGALACAQGGTDVDAPLIRSLQRLGEEEWAQADILMVTDGEIRPPGEEVMT